MSVLLETVDLKKTYKVGKIEVEALRGVSIRVDTGEFVAIMGPSGCGKSTLMHLLGAMTRATAGKVFIEGKDTANMNDAARTEIRRTKLGFVFQKFNLLPALTARQNIEVARKIYGEPRTHEGDAHLAEILALLHIEEKLDRKTRGHRTSSHESTGHPAGGRAYRGSGLEKLGDRVENVSGTKQASETDHPSGHS